MRVCGYMSLSSPDQRLNLVKKSQEEEDSVKGQLICEYTRFCVCVVLWSADCHFVRSACTACCVCHWVVCQHACMHN